MLVCTAKRSHLPHPFVPSLMLRGVNYIYGTGAALVGLHRAGIPSNDSTLLRGARWLVAHQNADGGWGETSASYNNEKLAGVGSVDVCCGGPCNALVTRITNYTRGSNSLTTPRIDLWHCKCFGFFRRRIHMVA